MKTRFYIALAVSAVLTALLVPLAVCLRGGLWITLATTAGTTLYHLLMRLAVGFCLEKAMTSCKNVNFEGHWFRERKWEARVYRILRVRKWARRVPTFKPEQFDVRTHTTKELVLQTCLSELVHEVIVVLGFASLLFCFAFEDPLANLAPFLITAILAGLYDLQFVILQRYHRPQLLRLMQRQELREQSKTPQKSVGETRRETK